MGYHISGVLNSVGDLDVCEIGSRYSGVVRRWWMYVCVDGRHSGMCLKKMLEENFVRSFLVFFLMISVYQ